jgi:hypothetical protein
MGTVSWLCVRALPYKGRSRLYEDVPIKGPLPNRYQVKHLATAVIM